MKQIFTVCAFFATLLLPKIGRCDAPINLSDEPTLSLNHWAYNAYDSLVVSGLLRSRYPPGFYSGPPVEMTRYECALNLITSLHRNTNETRHEEKVFGTTVLERRDALAALLREFSPELNEIGGKMRVDSSSVTFNGVTYKLIIVDGLLKVQRSEAIRPAPSPR